MAGIIGYMIGSGSLIAEANLRENLYLSPFRLIFVIVWFYLCINSIKHVEFSRVIPEPIRLPIKILTLFCGPLVVAAVIIIEAWIKWQQGKASFVSTLVDSTVSLLKAKHHHGPAQQSDSDITLFDSSGKTLDEIYTSAKAQKTSSVAVDFTEQMISDALNLGASDILIDPTSPTQYTIRTRVDGTLREYDSIETELASAVVNSIKAVSNMDISERRRPQDGSFNAKKTEGMVAFRVASAGVLNGEKLSVRILDQTKGIMGLAELGLTEDHNKFILNAIHQPSGLILICGPTGSGKTTTLYSMLASIDVSTRNVISVEDPIEYTFQNVSQIEINHKAGITFGKTLRSVLRQDPDVICIGEIRDEETASIALQAAQTGHLVIATIHSSSNAAAIVRLIDLGVKPLLITSALSMVISQRLVRCLCTNCKSHETLTDAHIEKLGSRGVDHKNMFRARGCLDCGHTGYKGRAAIFDILVMNENIKSDILDGKITAHSVSQYDNKNGKSVLKREAMKKVLTGKTTLNEVKRVVSTISN